MVNETEGRSEGATNPKLSGDPSRTGPAFAEAEERVLDLTSELLKILPKAPRERVTCRRITGNYYRCNWWSPAEADRYDNPKMSGLTVTTHRVSKSQMLHVTRTAKGLEIRQRDQS